MSNDSAKEQSSSITVSQLEISQKKETLSPYFIAQSIALPEARSNPASSSNKTKKRSKSNHSSNICSSVSTNSFSDASLYDHHVSNTVSEERLPSSFRSKRFKSQNQSNSNNIPCKQMVNSNHTASQLNQAYCRDEQEVVMNTEYPPFSEQNIDTDEQNDYPSHSIASEHSHQQGLSAKKVDKSKTINTHPEAPKHFNSPHRSSTPTSASSYWDQKVKRMYL